RLADPAQIQDEVPASLVEQVPDITPGVDIPRVVHQPGEIAQDHHVAIDPDVERHLGPRKVWRDGPADPATPGAPRAPAGRRTAVRPGTGRPVPIPMGSRARAYWLVNLPQGGRGETCGRPTGGVRRPAPNSPSNED